MKLEHVTRLPDGDAHANPILFVHGVSHGAWCWEPWIDWFAARGREVHAISLRGHGESEGREALNRFGLDDYCEDVLSTARSLGRAPVLVGHSMGGAIAQLALAADPNAFTAAVLLAPLPHNSMSKLEMLRMILRGGLTRGQRKLARGQPLSAEEVRSLSFFGRRITVQEAERYGSLLQPESTRAVGDLMKFSIPPLTDRPPLLVLGSANDVLFGRRALARTARHHRADLDVMEKACHDIQLDPLRDEGAARLMAWLERNDL